MFSFRKGNLIGRFNLEKHVSNLQDLAQSTKEYVGHMAPVGTQHATHMGQIRQLFVAVVLDGKVIVVIYQVGFNIDFIFK